MGSNTVTRSHDFISVKSEAIRQVKLALEEAEMDMPEPIYRVQLTERSAVLTPTAGAPESPAAKPKLQPSSESAVDMRVQGDLDAQIAQDQSKRGAEDLLDPSAPRE